MGGTFTASIYSLPPCPPPRHRGDDAPAPGREAEGP